LNSANYPISGQALLAIFKKRSGFPVTAQWGEKAESHQGVMSILSRFIALHDIWICFETASIHWLLTMGYAFYLSIIIFYEKSSTLSGKLIKGDFNMNQIIDIHAHLGDICFPGGGELIEKKGVRKKLLFDTVRLTELLLYRGVGNINPESVVKMGNWFYRRSFKETMARNLAGTRENFKKSMDEAGIHFSVSLPIPPYVTFADLKTAAEKDSSILPFTGIDFTREYDVEARLVEDVKAGARGLKLHPILQGEKLTSKRTFEGVEAFAPHNLPVLMHTGISAYYPDRSNTLMEQPSYGDIHYVRDIVKAFPGVSFIIGHGGMLQKQETMEMLGGCKNIWVDTSLSSPRVIREYFKVYGPERVLFGSDWPWGNRNPAKRSLKKACQGDKSLEKRIFSENAVELMQLNS